MAQRLAGRQRLLSATLRRGLGWSRGRGGLLHRRLPRTPLRCLCRWSLHRRFLDGHVLPNRPRFLCRCRPRLGSGLLQTPPPFRGRDDPLQTLFADAALGLRRCRGSWRRGRRLASDLSPAPLLGCPHPASSGRGESPGLWCRCFRRDDWLAIATRQHGPEFGNLGVDSGLVRFKPRNCSVDNFRRKLSWHVCCTSILSIMFTDAGLNTIRNQLFDATARSL